jgi:hypothetical protein
LYTPGITTRAGLVAGLAGVVLIAGVLGLAAQGWNPADYRPIPFSKLLDKPATAPSFVPGGAITPGLLEDLVRTEATDTGNRRLAQTDPRLMDAWILARHFEHDVGKAFLQEYEFTDGTAVAWVPMFLFVAPDGVRTVPAGGRMGLYVHRIALGQLGPVAVALQARALP